MELPPQMARLFGQPVIIVDGDALRRPPWNGVSDVASRSINEMGVRSAIAQGLKGPNGQPAPVTTAGGLSGSGQRLYLLCQGGGQQGPKVLVGLLKVGVKSLFHWLPSGMRELPNQLCVLDFYVHEDWQRRGAGKGLFAAMLQAEDVGPEALAYDRPSPKLIGFLRKHYGLTDYVPQQNNYVIFEQFFQHRAPPPKSPYDSVANRPLTARGQRGRAAR